MKKSVLFIVFVVFALSVNSAERIREESLCDSVFSYALQQLPYLIDYTDKYNLSRKQNVGLHSNMAFRTLLFIYPFWRDYLFEKIGILKGKDADLIMPVSVDHHTKNIVMGSIYDWRSGFFPGILWLIYDYSHNAYYKEKAIAYTKKLTPVTTFSKHDLGFMVNNSFGKAYDELGGAEFKRTIVQASKTLANRYNPQVKCIKSWNTTKSREFPVIIDNMMNLELLFHATQLTGDSSFYYIAVNHANTTRENHFRKNFSSYHIVDYDSLSGKPKKKSTGQGKADESYWSRGQAWGLYGFTMCYRYSRNSQFLKTATNIADFLLGLNYADDLIPYWDMSCLASPDIPRDASSASIMASALIELSQYTSKNNGERYLNYAYSLLKNLHSYYQSPLGGNYGFLLLHSTSHFRRDIEVDTPLIYADYYYLEAALRLKNLYHISDGRNITKE